MKNYKVFLKLLPLQGALLIAIIPRAMPWARSFCPFRACGAYLQKLNQFRFYKSAAKIHFLIETAKEF